MSVDRYAFINAKLRARMGAMLDDEKVESLMHSQSLGELLDSLKDTPYATLAELYDRTADIQQLESYLFARNVAIHQQVTGYLEGIHAQVVIALTRKLEVENLKGAIRLWFSNVVKHQNIGYRFGYLYQKQIVSPIDWNGIVNAAFFEEIQKVLAVTPYSQAAASVDHQSIERKGLFALETALDRTWFNLLWDVVDRMPHNDRQLTRNVYDRDADLKNSINLIRFGWIYRLPPDQLRTLMLRGGTLVSSREFMRYLAAPPEERSPIDLVKKRFPDLAKELEGMGKASVIEQTRRIEQYLFSLRKREFHELLHGYPFHFGVVLSYFFLEERQDNLIKALLNGAYYGWPRQRIKEFAV